VQAGALSEWLHRLYAVCSPAHPHTSFGTYLERYSKLPCSNRQQLLQPFHLCPGTLTQLH
jgi:hypothetical protein